MSKPISPVPPGKERAIYLAGVFDTSLTIQVYMATKGGLTIQITKTNRDPRIPMQIFEASGYIGNIFETKGGTRWHVTGNGNIRNFLQLIEPYVRIKKFELGLLYRMTSPSTTKHEKEALYDEWQTYRHSVREEPV